MTRDEVLDNIDRFVSLSRRKIDRKDVPVQFLEDRVAVVLPAERFTPDEQIRLEGKVQNWMSTQRHAHVFLDFVQDWRGLDSRMKGGFN